MTQSVSEMVQEFLESESEWRLQKARLAHLLLHVIGAIKGQASELLLTGCQSMPAGRI